MFSVEGKVSLDPVKQLVEMFKIVRRDKTRDNIVIDSENIGVQNIQAWEVILPWVNLLFPVRKA